MPVTTSRATPAPSIATLMHAYLEGDFTALAELYRRLVPRVRRTVQARIHDPDLAEDIVQQTFLRAHFGRHGFRARSGETVASEDAVVAWYLAIARNTAIDGVRSEQRHQRGRVPADDEIRPWPTHDARPHVEDPEQHWLADEERSATQARVRAAIFDLPASQRDVVVLHKLRGLPMQAVAEQLHVRPGAARVRAHRAYATLAKRLAA